MAAAGTGTMPVRAGVGAVVAAILLYRVSDCHDTHAVGTGTFLAGYRRHRHSPSSVT